MHAWRSARDVRHSSSDGAWPPLHPVLPLRPQRSRDDSSTLCLDLVRFSSSLGADRPSHPTPHQRLRSPCSQGHSPERFVMVSVSRCSSLMSRLKDIYISCLLGLAVRFGLVFDDFDRLPAALILFSTSLSALATTSRRPHRRPARSANVFACPEGGKRPMDPKPRPPQCRRPVGSPLAFSVPPSGPRQQGNCWGLNDIEWLAWGVPSRLSISKTER